MNCAAQPTACAIRGAVSAGRATRRPVTEARRVQCAMLGRQRLSAPSRKLLLTITVPAQEPGRLGTHWNAVAGPGQLAQHPATVRILLLHWLPHTHKGLRCKCFIPSLAARRMDWICSPAVLRPNKRRAV